jgi:hypothetical protein
MSSLGRLHDMLLTQRALVVALLLQPAPHDNVEQKRVEAGGPNSAHSECQLRQQQLLLP